MYIENGEDIYLTIYKEESKKNYNYNYVFKYVNAWKNGDFKNYIIKNDNLDYDIEERNINITEFKGFLVLKSYNIILLSYDVDNNILLSL